MFWFMLQVDPIKSYLNLKTGLPPVLKAGSSGNVIKIISINQKNYWKNREKCPEHWKL